MYKDLELFLSKERLDRFLIATERSEADAIALYEKNIKVSKAFYPVLNLFEIFFRNIINENVSKTFNNKDWILTVNSGFMNHKSLSKSYFLKNSVLKAKKRIRKNGSKVTYSNVIAEQNLGFWTSFFDSNSFGLTKGIPLKCFPNKPKLEKRETIKIKLDNIRDFRNRIYHNEPICFSGKTVNFDKAIKIKNDIYDLLLWMNADFIYYNSYFEEIEKEIKM
ncbi:hypothetical protein G1K73_13275 [Tenacibaculum finnmarkense]|uniref:Abi family protein n=1 Tax=Tenacibaculum finnmarkense TaxID=2781243 RepID=UPI001EFAC1A0|nr:Abi family protein [Tenacibaculum finnmarkense]MCG8894713.1 hypothetical protein [Tenacibaculum finnmarkense]